MVTDKNEPVQLVAENMSESGGVDNKNNIMN